MKLEQLEQFKQQHQNVQIIDVRGAQAYEERHLEGALHLPLETLADDFKQLDPKAPTVVYCTRGVKSHLAAELLQANGFQHVVEIDGGIG